MSKLFISERSIHPYILTVPCLSIFLSVHGFPYSHIFLNHPWIPIFLTGPGIPLFWTVRESQYFRPVRGSLYYEPSIDPCILSGPWIPIFWMVHGSLFSGRSIVSFILIGPWIPFFPKNVLSRQNPDSSPDSVRTKFVFIFQNCPDWIQIFFWKLSGPDKIQIWIWTQSGHFFKIKIKFVQIESRFKSGFCLDQTVSRKKSGQENQIIWTRFESGRILPTSDVFWKKGKYDQIITGQSISLNWRVLFKKLPKKLISVWVLAYCSSRHNFKHNSSSINVVLYYTRSGLVPIGPVLHLVLYYTICIIENYVRLQGVLFKVP